VDKSALRGRHARYRSPMQPRPRRLSRKISGVHLGAEYTFQKNFRGALRRKKKKKKKKQKKIEGGE